MRPARLFSATRRINTACSGLIGFLSDCSLRRFLRYSPALKVRASVSVRVAVISGFLTIPCSGLPEAAAEVKRYALPN